MRFIANFKIHFFLICILLLTRSVMAQDVTKPHTFSAGTPASASEVNANFDVLYEEINKLRGEIEELKQAKGLPAADYDSGWFYVEKGAKEYLKDHGLGVLPRLVMMWGAADKDGKDMIVIDLVKNTDGTDTGCLLRSITTTSYVVRTGSTGVFHGPASSGYIRILMWK